MLQSPAETHIVHYFCSQTAVAMGYAEAGVAAVPGPDGFALAESGAEEGAATAADKAATGATRKDSRLLDGS